MNRKYDYSSLKMIQISLKLEPSPNETSSINDVNKKYEDRMFVENQKEVYFKFNDR